MKTKIFVASYGHRILRINILGFECAQEMNALNQIGYFIFKGGRASFLLLIVFGHSVMILNLVFIEIEIPSLIFFAKLLL